MALPCIIIAEDPTTFGKSYRRLLSRDFNAVLVEKDCEKLIAGIKQFQPQLVITNLFLSGGSAAELLRRLAKEKTESAPLIIVRSDFKERECQEESLPDYLYAKKYADLFLDDFVSLNFLQNVVNEMIGDLLPKKIQPMNRIECLITGLLLDLQMPTQLLGYQYIKDAIEFQIVTGHNMVTKDIYPMLSKKYNTASWYAIERVMRYAVDTTWEQGAEEKLKRYFGKNKPSNKQFIARMIEEVNVLFANQEEQAAK